jgi:spore germination protein GerM
MEDHQPIADSTSTPQRDRPPLGRRTLPIIIGLSTFALATTGGIVWWTSRYVPAPVSSVPSPTAPALQSPQPQAQQNPAQQSIQIYWLKANGNDVELTPSSITVASGQPDAVLKAAFDQLLKGSAETNLTSTIPAGTQLRNLEVKEDGVHVDLSQAFTSGGGSTSMIGRAAQVIYTASTLDPKANVWISVEGEPLEVLGGEGLELSQPITRTEFEQNFDL